MPIVLNWKLWAAVWSGELSRGWDGTGHYALAQYYDQTIFPNTIGWTDGYFGGMPFPNFYPPVFYWCVALLQHTRLFSFNSAFNLVLTVPVLVMPAAIWWLAWHLSNRSRLIATAASVASVILLTDLRFMGSLLAGLDYFSTFQIGLYTQPLGFVLMIAWFVVYSRSNSALPNAEQANGSAYPVATAPGSLPLSSLLLALTVLSNFFNAITAVVFIAVTIANDLIHVRRTIDLKQNRAALLRHLLSPAIALLLCLFWLVPMITEYRYFVTRPYAPETQSLLSPWLIAWYALALLGSLVWWRERALQYKSRVETSAKQSKSDGRKMSVRPANVSAQAGAVLDGESRAMVSYLITCTILAAAVIFSAAFAPSWFPLQTPRFLATLTFLLTVPVGFVLAWAFQWFARLLGEISSKNPRISLKQTSFSLGTAALIFIILVMSAPDLSWAYAFYPKGQRSGIDDVLDFARQNRAGRYLVEVINPKVGPAWTEASFDARAINSYLGSQGNETISGVFHEASPNALFTLPTVNAFSNYPDSFGVSSVLADDLDFAGQPLSEQIKRAQFLGVKYLIIRTPAMKERVSKEITSAIRHDIGWWAVFELSDQPAPKIRALAYKPALVLSSFTVKARHRNEMSFIRLAEEQFADNWFDVLLVHSGESKIDRLRELDKFGSLIIDSYDYGDETAAFERLRQFAQAHAVICLSADNPLFKRIQAAHADFPSLEIIDRQAEQPGEVVEALKPTYHYDTSSIRNQWQMIRRVLDQKKIPTNAAAMKLTGVVDQQSIKINSNSMNDSGGVPVLIANTFHPNWRRTDAKLVYATTPFNMLTFVSDSATISYGRGPFDRYGLWVSAVTLLLIGLLTARSLISILLSDESSKAHS